MSVVIYVTHSYPVFLDSNLQPKDQPENILVPFAAAGKNLDGPVNEKYDRARDQRIILSCRVCSESFNCCS